MIASRKLDKLVDVATEIQTSIPDYRDGQLQYMECNIREEGQVKDLVKTTLNKFGKIDILVNNAGGQFPSPMSNISLKGWNAVVETNLTGTFMCCKQVYNEWMRDHGGSIVNIIADMFKGFPGMSHTGAARSGVDNLTKTLSIEWAASGVRINAVAPGTIYSASASANYESTGIDVFELQRPHIPAKRLGTTHEISAPVLFLLSPAAAFISGHTMRVDGAQTLYSTAGPFPIEDHTNLPAYTWEKDAQDKNKSKL